MRAVEWANRKVAAALRFVRGPACPVCASRRTEHCKTAYWYRYARCRACGMIFAENPPAFDDLKKRYCAGYLEQRKAQFAQPDRTTWNDGWVAFRGGVFERFLPAHEKASGAGRKALEIGCAEGRQMQILADRGWDVTGVEMGGDMVEEGRRRGLRILQGAIEDVEFPPATFDLAVMSHVIEHLRDPAGVLRAVHRVAKPGALLIVETPCIHDFDDRDHLQFFTEPTLTRLLRGARFAPLGRMRQDYCIDGRQYRDIVVCARRD